MKRLLDDKRLLARMAGNIFPGVFATGLYNDIGSADMAVAMAIRICNDLDVRFPEPEVKHVDLSDVVIGHPVR